MVLGSRCVDVGSSRRVIGATDKERDKTDQLSYIYIYIERERRDVKLHPKLMGT